LRVCLAAEGSEKWRCVVGVAVVDEDLEWVLRVIGFVVGVVIFLGWI
jgi:hypothetical protein